MFDSPRAVLDAWLAGVNAGDKEALLALYSEDAVLMPTFADRRLRTPADIDAYFTALSRRRGLAVELHERTLVAQALGDGVHSLNGIYRWQFEVDDEPLTFEARFTYVVDLARERPIVHHHSSQVPRTL